MASINNKIIRGISLKDISMIMLEDIIDNDNVGIKYPDGDCIIHTMDKCYTMFISGDIYYMWVNMNGTIKKLEQSTISDGDINSYNNILPMQLSEAQVLNNYQLQILTQGAEANSKFKEIINNYYQSFFLRDDINDGLIAGLNKVINKYKCIINKNNKIIKMNS